jgi:glyoxylase-like metal-dependent hydrolase (beta-lactamase superfamily II)
MMRFAPTAAWSVIAIAMIALAPPAHAQDDVAREIAAVRGDLYTMREGSEVTIFLVTPDGIVLSDPLNESAAKWLLREFNERFPGKTVRYVLLTHHHFDRAGGAWVFKDTAEVVGHQNFERALSASRHDLPAQLASLDRNGNNVFDRSELADAPEAPPLKRRDRNEDGNVTPDELYTDIQSVESTFQSRRRITLGGRNVDLIYTGEAHAPDMAALFFPEERVLFAVDAPPVTSAPFSFSLYTPKQVHDWTQAVMPLDFDIVLSGRGDTTAKADVAGFAQYLDNLITGVRAGFDSNRSLERVRAEVMSQSAVGTLTMSQQRPVHVADVFASFRKVTIDVQGAAVVARVSREENYCEAFTCSAPLQDVTHGGTIAFVTGMGRIGASIEAQVDQEGHGSRAGLFYEDEIVHRDTSWAFLFRYTPQPQSRMTVTFVGGPAFVTSNIRGFSRSRFNGIPFGPLSEINYTTSGLGFAAGADLVGSLTRRLSLVVPIRFRRTSADAWTDVVTQSSVKVGAGLSWSVVRHVYMK